MIAKRSNNRLPQRKAVQPHYVICIQNAGYEASLEPRKIYRSLPDKEGAGAGFIRVIDESGEDYLFPKALFRPIQLALSIRRALDMSA